MALINRISRLFKSDFHAVLDQIEEPEQLLKQAIRDMEDELASAEQRIALCAHDQDSLSARKNELESAMASAPILLAEYGDCPCSGWVSSMGTRNAVP